MHITDAFPFLPYTLDIVKNIVDVLFKETFLSFKPVLRSLIRYTVNVANISALEDCKTIICLDAIGMNLSIIS